MAVTKATAAQTTPKTSPVTISALLWGYINRTAFKMCAFPHNHVLKGNKLTMPEPKILKIVSRSFLSLNSPTTFKAAKT